MRRVASFFFCHNETAKFMKHSKRRGLNPHKISRSLSFQTASEWKNRAATRSCVPALGKVREQQWELTQRTIIRESSRKCNVEIFQQFVGISWETFSQPRKMRSENLFFYWSHAIVAREKTHFKLIMFSTRQSYIRRHLKVPSWWALRGTKTWLRVALKKGKKERQRGRERP